MTSNLGPDLGKLFELLFGMAGFMLFGGVALLIVWGGGFPFSWGNVGLVALAASVGSYTSRRVCTVLIE